jgi:site-specific DNA recombinase
MVTVPAPATLRAAIYTRVSTLEQGEHGYSLEAQECDCRRLASDLGQEVVAVYTDQASGTRWDLPGLYDLLDAAKRGEYSTLLCFDPDRLSRKLSKLLVLEDELARHGVSVRYCTLRGGDTAEDRLFRNMKGAFAEYDREKIAFRLARGRRAKAERGQFVGIGQLPYGYLPVRNDRGAIVGLEPDPLTASTLREIFERLRYESSQRVTDWLNATGVPAPRGSRGWVRSTVVRIATSTAYIGRWHYGRQGRRLSIAGAEDTIAVAVPPLVSPAIWEEVQRALHARTTTRPARRAGPDPFELRGRAVCGFCNGLLTTEYRNREYRYYSCMKTYAGRSRSNYHGQRCTAGGVYAPALEQYVWEIVAGNLLQPDRLKAGLASARSSHEEAAYRQRERLTAIDAEAARLRQRIGRLIEDRQDLPRGGEADRLVLQKIAEAEGVLA